MKHLRVIAVLMMIAGFSTQLNAQLDTTGLSGWKQMHNSLDSWEEGAFNAYATGYPDYGWGLYNMISHGLIADSLFVIKLQDGSFKKLWIVEKNGVSVYTFRYANLDGTNEKETELDMTKYSGKHFVYYNLRGDSTVNEQPASDKWDLMLTKFIQTEINYPVTGFLSNDKVTVSVFNAADSTTAADATLADTTEFTDSISAIGNSWYKMVGYSMVPLDTIAYFVKNTDGVIYKMQVTYFESGLSGLGRIGIRKQLLHGTGNPPFVYDTLIMGASYATEEYYSMKNGSAGRVLRNSWDIGFKSGTFTSSITANTTMGVELYTYANGDTSAWHLISSITRPTIMDGGISLYPVPASDLLTIKSVLKTQLPLNISVFDLTGKQVLHRTSEPAGSGELRLDISELHAGIYILQVRNREVQAVSKFSIR